LDHIGFVVDDVESTYREMNSKGAEPTGITPSETGGWQACVKDPDGNWIEFAKG
jgi:catechol 2,3-dioxygenase-like lactoylglutathione lyase family enzyme